MTAVLLVSVGLLTLAMAWAMLVMVRSAEARAGLLMLACGFLALRAAFGLWDAGAAPLTPGLATAGELSAFAASALALLVVGGLARTLRERNRAEVLHWDSMEVVRALGEFGADDNSEFARDLPGLLETGCNRFGLEVGIVARRRAGLYVIEAIRAPEGFPFERGASVPAEETLCARAFAAPGPIAVAQVEDPETAATREAFGFQSLLGVAIRSGGAPYGTLCFGSRKPHPGGFSEADGQLLELIATWIGQRLGRRDADTSRRRAAAWAVRERSQPPLARKTRRAAAGNGSPPRRWDQFLPRRGVDVNAVVRRMDQKLRKLVGPGVELEVSLAPDLAPALPPRVPIDAVLRSLVASAREAMGSGGKITVETANLDLTGSKPGVVPAVAPNRYVTLSVRDSGNGAAAEALSRTLTSRPASEPVRGREGTLALPTLYRLLQRSGGDLSVETEPGRGSTFRVFLPPSGPANRPFSDRELPPDPV